MTTDPKGTVPYEYDPLDDPLNAQVCAREDEDVVRDPEAGTEGETVRVECGKAAQPVTVQLPERV